MVSVQVESAGRVLRCSIEVEAAGAVVLADAFSDCATSADLKAALSMGGA